MKKTAAIAIVVFCFASSISTPANGSVVAGGKCTVTSQIKSFQGKKFTCVKSGKKLIWRKEKLAKKTSSAPISTPITATSTLTSSEDYLSIDQCKLVNGSGVSGVNQSSQQNPFRVKTTKLIRGLILPIDFQDLTGISNPQSDFASITEGVSRYFGEMSEGRTKFKWTIHPEFVRYPIKVAEANLGGRTANGYGQFSREALNLAKKVLDISNFDLIVYAPPLETTRQQIAVGPAFVSNGLDQINATMLDGQAYSSKNPYLMTAHEIGHLMGLSDLYNYEAANESAASSGKFNSNDFQFKYMGIFDLMNWVGGEAMELTAWNRWVIDLISDDQIRCLPSKSTTTLLTPVGVHGGVKAVVIPLSSTEAIVVESRRAIRFDAGLGTKSEGALVYKVNTSTRSGLGPMRVVTRPGSSDMLHRDAPIALNESLLQDNYLIEVIEKGAFGDVVRVSKQ